MRYFVTLIMSTLLAISPALAQGTFDTPGDMGQSQQQQDSFSQYKDQRNSDPFMHRDGEIKLAHDWYLYAIKENGNIGGCMLSAVGAKAQEAENKIGLKRYLAGMYGIRANPSQNLRTMHTFFIELDGATVVPEKTYQLQIAFKKRGKWTDISTVSVVALSSTRVAFEVTDNFITAFNNQSVMWLKMEGVHLGNLSLKGSSNGLNKYFRCMAGEDFFENE